jgi:hypothetical protein
MREREREKKEDEFLIADESLLNFIGRIRERERERERRILRPMSHFIEKRRQTYRVDFHGKPTVAPLTSIHSISHSTLDSFFHQLSTHNACQPIIVV